MNKNIANNIKIFNLIILLLFSVNSYAGTLTIPTVYQNNGTVTAANLNGNFTAGAQVINGGLDNTNANTTQGYRFYQTVSVLPSPGNQGAVYFLTTDNTLNFDTGSSFIKTISISGSPTSGQVPVYNGSVWIPTTENFVPSGVIMMWHGSIASIPSGYALCNGSNGTPDLRNKFIVAADADVAGTAETTYTGVATQTGGSLHHTHTYSGTTTGPSATGGSGGSGASGVTQTHTHDYSGTTANESAVPVVYYALAYIMKL